jgi:hypothetical protein
MEKNMAKYIVRDLFSMLRYLPWGIIVGIVLVMILKAINDGRKRKNKSNNDKMRQLSV